jgi:F1F0 ATPase subunit 2
MTSFVFWLIAGAAVGFAAGVLHFASLHWNGRLFAAGRMAAAFGVQVARIAIACAILFVLARAGAAAFLAGAAAFLLARQFVMWPLYRRGA